METHPKRTKKLFKFFNKNIKKQNKLKKIECIFVNV